MLDGCGRQIDHLRLSLTDYCNLACRYCAPEAGHPDCQVIDSDLAFAIVRWLSDAHGISHVRLTGGEPLLYPGLIPLIERLRGLRSLRQLTLTTNGQMLARMAGLLADAGLSRINISLDTLDPKRYEHLTRGGKIERTLSGIKAAVRAGLTPVKINIVAQRGLNDHELADMAEWGLRHECIVRFLEVMPIGPLAHMVDQHLVGQSEILDRLSERFDLRPIAHSVGQPATDYAAAGQGLHGVVGIIAPMTHPFCSRCRRLRVTSGGWLVACLHDKTRFPLTQWWDGQQLDAEGADVTLRQAVAGKRLIGPQNQSSTMLALGG